MIKNKKTVDPKDDESTKVLQLETAMGAAIECFDGAIAITVPRTRFAPVKKCDDLILLRSDAYVITDDSRVMINPECKDGKAPVVSLAKKQYKLVDKLEAATKKGIPSLVQCERLTIKGKVLMSSKCVFVGEVELINESDEAKTVPQRLIENETLDLTNEVENSCVLL